MNPEFLVLGIVGPCAAGKTTLVAGLRQRGYRARHIAQEHSYVPDMWRQIGKPDFLIYLDVSYDVSVRRTGSSWVKKIYDYQVQRLAHARENADFYLPTDDLTPDQVLEQVLAQIEPPQQD